MDLVDWFFPEQAQAASLRDLAASTRLLHAKSAPLKSSLSANAEDLGLLALVLLSLVESLVAKNVISKEELVSNLRALDARDGVQDMKMRMQALREILGLPAAPKPSPVKAIGKRVRRKPR